ncbi:hypothetical protein ALO61_200080 [Pseudomonas savastanoi pv. nerii]|nr:hypothetical protein ALO61_200080 [Pseudomonas savastanoi pv. nerii]RML74755.1 hypothetical protein ALQ90_200369 [Pseudomonas savastanoi pv. savastanoi]RML91910.1 hypothetical protein ALQ88_200237 [Pseudomonas savastanoi]RMR63981.1 hypothetical protein ALP81_200033 [Pseudomonas savastanoi pv. fraxini]RMR65305.1 hypothetical protein ALP80_200226 [Pseudomonas savastanoi pv. fraxini]
MVETVLACPVFTQLNRRPRSTLKRMPYPMDLWMLPARAQLLHVFVAYEGVWNATASKTLH